MEPLQVAEQEEEPPESWDPILTTRSQPGALVNTFVTGSGHPKRCPQRPLRDGIPQGQKLYLQQLIGPPKYRVPWWTAPPYSGTRCFSGLRAGTILGPVLDWKFVPRTGLKAGYLSCCIKTPPGWEYKSMRTPPAEVWVNVWCTDNDNRRQVGISYCEPIFVRCDGLHRGR